MTNRLVRDLTATDSDAEIPLETIEAEPKQANLQKKRPPLGITLQRWVDNSINRIQSFWSENARPLFEDMRSKQMREISLDEEILSEEQKMMNRHFVFSSILVVSTVACSLIYVPLLWIHAPLAVYLQIPEYKRAWEEFRQRGVTTKVVDMVVGFVAVGFIFVNLKLLVVAAFSGWVGSYTNKLVAQSKDGTRKKLTNLFGQQPKFVWIIQDGTEVEIPFEQLQTGDNVVVEAGQMIPVDGVIVDGIASVDQHMLTGEAQPIEKSVGDSVFAATVVLAGRLILTVEKTGSQTTAAQVGQILADTSNFTAGVHLRGKEIADRSALPNLLLGFASLPFIGVSSALAVTFARAGGSMAVLGPLSVMNFLQLTSREGILIKDGRALEQVSKVDTVVFDKTGTLTQETPHVGRLFTWHNVDETQLLTYAAAAEQRQTHPIARAILEEANRCGCTVPAINESAYEIGYGIKVKLDTVQIRVGSHRFMQMEQVTMPSEVDEIQQTMHEEGHSLVYVAVEHQLIGMIELVPTIRPEARRVVRYLQQKGLEIVIISGDHERPTHALASSLGIDRYFAETLPENKADLITQLQAEGKTVCFVGDGINDSIALKKANVSVSLSGASTAATDSAQIILMDTTLNQLTALFDLSKKFETNMTANLVSSIVPSAVTIVGALTGVVGFGLCMVIGTAGLVSGVINAMIPRFTLLSNTDAERTVVPRLE